MKFYLNLLVFAVILAGLNVAFANDLYPFSITNKVASTNTVTTKNLYGFVDSVHIDVTGTTTGLLTLVSGQDVIVSNTVTADKVIRPRTPTDNYIGGSLASGTNIYGKFLLVDERITVRLVESFTTTNTYSIKIKLSDN